MTAFREIRYRLPADREDDFAAWLAKQGSLGCSVDTVPADDGSVCVTAYFQDDGSGDQPDPNELAGWDAVEESSSRLEDADWLAAYRAASVPFEIGTSFRVDSGEPDDPEAGPAGVADDDSRHLLRIPARTAFGTGSHESTRLCVLWLEDLARRSEFPKRRILDVGTGSGILAFCAEKLGAKRVSGYDLDAAAVLVARDNARRNACRPALWAGTLDSLSANARFDLAVVNVLPERILDAYPQLLARLVPGALVISSGNLVERRDDLLAQFARMGLALQGQKSEGEWTSFLLSYGAPGDARPGQ